MRPLGVGVVMLVLSTSARPVVAAAQTSTAIALDTVLVSSGALRLSGLLWRPDGPGPFPAILFSHGDGAGIDAARARARADAVGPVFAKHGYVLLYLFRRGFGLSAAQGESLPLVLDREARRGGLEARQRMQLVLLTTDHLDDLMAGLSYLKTRPSVDPRRVALVGHSFGGRLTLLAAERDTTIRAAITFAAAAQGWSTGSAAMRERMLTALRNLKASVFLIHAANDYSTVPGEAMAAELARLRRPHQLKIYPAVGRTPAEGHDAVYTDVGTWEGDVFRFLAEHVHR